MTDNREYLHLEEASSIEGLNKFLLIDLFQKGEVNFYCWCHAEKLYAEGTYKGNKLPSILGRFSYSGAVKIPKASINDLLTKQKPVKVRRFVIQEPDSISKWQDVAPSTLSYPNKAYQEYRHCKKPEHFITCFISATNSSKTQAAQSIGRLFNSFMKHQLDDMNDKDQEKLNSSVSDLKQHFDNEVSYEPKEFFPADLRFSKTELEKTIKPIPNLAQDPNIKAPSPLDEIILDILLNEAGRSDQIWNILRTESRKDILERKYDKYGVVEEVSTTNLIWLDRSQNTRQLTRESFKNKVSKLKKKYLKK